MENYTHETCVGEVCLYKLKSGTFSRLSFDEKVKLIAKGRILLVIFLSFWPRICEVQGRLSDSYTLPSSIVLREGQMFDYIVVGAGAAGAAAAARLGLAGADVLLVEAGGDPTLLSRIPSASMALLGSDIDWQYKTVPNNVSCLSSQGQQCRFSRGKCLGGSTSINYMLYTRGNKQDFDDISIPGWSWDDLKPYFTRYEGLHDLDLLPLSSKAYHNTTGTMRIAFFDDPQNPWHRKLIKSFKFLGFPENADVNAQSQIGVSQVVGYVYGGERMSTARGYLARNDVKRTLKVAKNTLCIGVIIDKKNVARGISAVQGSKKLTLLARKEVILSAGSIGTPQILMLSGVGPSDHIHSMGIPVRVNLTGVGANMTDHVLPLLFARVDKRIGLMDDLVSLINRTEQLLQLLLQRSGPLTSNGLTDVNVFANSHCYDFQNRRLLNVSFDGSDCEVPNLQIIHAYIDRNLLRLARPVFQRAIGLDDDVLEQISKANDNHAFIVISPILLYPYSMGHIRLSKSNPLDPPAIFPNYLADEKDVDDIMKSIGIVEHLMETPSFRQQNASLLHLKLPECPSVHVNRSQYWRCYTRHMTFPVYHAAGTCALGRVVDARLRVRGVQRLRVADISVLPRVPRANTAAAAIAIGERVADFVLDDK